MDKVLLDKAYIVGKMEELMKTPIMQEYVYLQTKLKESEVVSTEKDDVTPDECIGGK